jgi:competence protein ComFC
MSAVLQTLSMLGRETARIVLHAACVACDGPLPWRDRIGSCCRSCWEALPAIQSAKCQSCALPWSGQDPGYCCGACLADPLPVDWAEAWGHYRGSLERVLHAFKFARHDWFSDPLADLLADTLKARGDLTFDAVTAVPMHRSKLRRRGYNQAELLARALSRKIGIPFDGSLLAKTVERSPQSSLPRAERSGNVRNAFVSRDSAKGKAILLVDDVSTTGETLRACAKVLGRAGAGRVCAVVVAKTE